MEYVEYGEVFKLLDESEGLKEEDAKYLFTLLLKCIESLHS
jgi:hypothetical protein